jgi:hypothetical protein
MKSLWQKISIASASFALMLGLTANSAQAAVFDFAVSIDFGPLDGQTFFGSFNFDKSGITGVGEEFLPVPQLTFDFLGSIFTEVTFERVPEPLGILGMVMAAGFGAFFK